MKIFKILFVFTILALSSQVLAQSSISVSSFLANPTYIPNAYGTAFSWSTVGGFGANLYINCPTGVTIKDDFGNTANCNTALSVGGQIPSGAAGYTFFNVTGSPKSVTVRLVPKDSSGIEQTGAASTIIVTVGAIVQPITDFSASTLAPQSGDTVKVTWTGVYINGVNLQFDCTEALRYTTADSALTEIKCGTIALASDLAASGSYDFKVFNNKDTSVSGRVMVVPSQGDGYYDGTKSLSLTLTVGGRAVPLQTAGTYFTVSKSNVYSGEPFDIYWSTSGAKGANIQFQCLYTSLSVAVVVGTSTTPLACNTLAFKEPLPVSGTTTISISNKDMISSYVDVQAFLLPQQNDGTYTALNSRSFSIRLMSGKPASNVHIPSVPTAFPTVSNQTAKTVFSIALTRGSRGAQVTALQEFLAKDKTIYPEGLVTGYFGVASEAAVKRFQVRYGLAKQGDAGYGYVGPKTRAQLNTLFVP